MPMKKVSFIMFLLLGLFRGYTGDDVFDIYPVFDCGMVFKRKN